MLKLCPIFSLPLYLVATGPRTIQFLFLLYRCRRVHNNILLLDHDKFLHTGRHILTCWQSLCKLFQRPVLLFSWVSNAINSEKQHPTPHAYKFCKYFPISRVGRDCEKLIVKNEPFLENCLFMSSSCSAPLLYNIRATAKKNLLYSTLTQTAFKPALNGTYFSLFPSFISINDSAGKEGRECGRRGERRMSFYAYDSPSNL
jgi:hypothetical protein